jgi:hypothetical protein
MEKVSWRSAFVTLDMIPGAGVEVKIKPTVNHHKKGKPIATHRLKVVGDPMDCPLQLCLYFTLEDARDFAREILEHVERSKRREVT